MHELPHGVVLAPPPLQRRQPVLPGCDEILRRPDPLPRRVLLDAGGPPPRRRAQREIIVTLLDGRVAVTRVLLIPVSLQPRERLVVCLLYTSPSPRDRTRSRMPSSA